MFGLPMLWIYVGVAAVVLALSGAVYVQSARLDTCKAEAKADKLLIQSLGDKISEQNTAVKAGEDATKAAKAKGAIAVTKARQQALGLQGEVARLSALLKKPAGVAKTCSDGVRDARAGMQ